MSSIADVAKREKKEKKERKEKKKEKKMATTNGNSYPMEMESLADFTEEEDDPEEELPTAFKYLMNPMAFIQNLFALIAAYASYYRNITIPVSVVAIILVVILTLDFVAAASTTAHVAGVERDYTDAHSEYELKMQQIDHWCLAGGDDNCRCDDPTMAMPREQKKGWVQAHKQNKLLINNQYNNVDVVLLGDQITEEWNGRWYGKPEQEMQKVKTWFDEKFSTTGGGDVNGVALGIAGDSISNLLWRLQHGEMPESLKPKVWWITIGGNDLDVGQCSEEAVTWGILRVAELISEKQPGAMVVINSVLPIIKTVKPGKNDAFFKRFDLFPSIQVVNEQLEKFCKKHTAFQFFDATNIFFDVPPVKAAAAAAKSHFTRKRTIPLHLKENLIEANGDLTVSGHKIWGEAIAAEVKVIMYDELYENQFEPGLVDDMFSGDDDYATDDYLNYSDPPN